MAHQGWHGAIEFNPGEVMKGEPRCINARAWNTGSIDIQRAAAVTVKGDAFALPPAQVVMHVPKHHEIGTPRILHSIQSQRKISITPINRRLFPITAAGTGGIGPQTGGPAMGQHHQRPIVGNTASGLNNATRRFFFCHRTEHGLNCLREVKPSSSTARTGTNDTHSWNRPGTERPRTIERAQQLQLLLETITAAVFPPVVVAENDGHRAVQLGDPLDQSKITIAEITDKQQGISAELLHQLCIPVSPVTVQISGNGKTERRQSNCLG